MAHVIADRVKETSTTTGTGDLALAGAITGFQAFSAACAVGDTLYYSIQAVDASGVPTGEWECGLGTYSSANTLTRTTVTSSSNAGAAVSLAAGTKQVYLSMPAVQVAWARERLTAARTYYVRTDGSDSNTGLVDSAGGAFLTIQQAVNAAASIDTGIYNVTIQIADGTYTGSTTLKAATGAGGITIQGNAATPANVVISTTGNHCFISIGHGATIYTVKDLKMQTTTSGRCLRVTGASRLNFSNVVFGACANSHIQADTGGAIVATGNYSIVGAALIHIEANRLGYVSTHARTVTITGTPAFSSSYLYAYGCSTVLCGDMTFSGAATGVRYNLALNATVDTQSGGATYLPGNSAGTTATGGQYV